MSSAATATLHAHPANTGLARVAIAISAAAGTVALAGAIVASRAGALLSEGIADLLLQLI